MNIKLLCFCRYFDRFGYGTQTINKLHEVFESVQQQPSKCKYVSREIGGHKPETVSWVFMAWRKCNYKNLQIPAPYFRFCEQFLIFFAVQCKSINCRKGCATNYLLIADFNNVTLVKITSFTLIYFD